MNAITYNVSSTSANNSSTGTAFQTSVTSAISANIPIIQTMVGGNAVTQFAYQDGVGAAQGLTQTEQLTLSSNTVQYSAWVDVYLDKVFNSFAYILEPPVPPGTPPALQGIVTNNAGKPLANQVVTVKFSNGRIGNVLTNSAGVYSVPGIPPGDVAVSVGSVTTGATVAAGKTLNKPLQIP